ncbi:oxidoreductase, short chain dehydrogenase/reductase family protein [Ancylostoma ceylanicum]|uniref:Oxidoreductase, short chain dehydrogenase/reductase family protein n=1 Tax=Ancylostoma ceylanicum TaxID=53326 RepID=A0A0D6LFI2_9BILA|nr:oxidoreductase, short chain dehydrogenase/reductase family protein [Ancylostoma ceylanicum]
MGTLSSPLGVLKAPHLFADTFFNRSPHHAAFSGKSRHHHWKEDGLQATKKAMLEAGAKEDDINVVAADVTDAHGREQIVSSTVQKFGQIDILVNNAGGAFRSESGSLKMDSGLDVLEKTMQLNLYSVVEMIQLARPHLVKSKGEIVNISSIAGQPMGFARTAFYSSAKAALDQLTRAAAMDLIADGVRVNSVSPGAVVTRFGQNMGFTDEMSEKVGTSYMYQFYASNRAALPAGKVGEPSDIASVIAFLADRSQSSYIVGQTIIADGGTTLVLASNATDFLGLAPKIDHLGIRCRATHTWSVCSHGFSSPHIMPRFQGKVAIVTGKIYLSLLPISSVDIHEHSHYLGSSSGIGAATAVLFAKEGAKVTITGRNQDGLQATKKAILEAGGKEDDVNVAVADVTDALGREHIISSTTQKFGQIDILVNNAGAAFRSESGSMGLDAGTDVLEKTMKLNLFSVVDLIQVARPHLVKSKGEIVNVSSMAGQPVAFANLPYYAAAKAALDQMSRAIAIELIAEGVRVNTVSPGAVVTRFGQNMGLTDEMTEQLYAYYASNRGILPCGKVAEPSDIANIIAFLADRSQSSYIVGQTIIADGGSILMLAACANETVNGQFK